MYTYIHLINTKTNQKKEIIKNDNCTYKDTYRDLFNGKIINNYFFPEILEMYTYIYSMRGKSEKKRK